MTRSSVAPRTAVVLAVAGAAVIYAITDNRAISDVCYLGVLVGASVGAWIGVQRAPRQSRWVPSLIALGLSLSALGDVLWTILDIVGADTDVSLADPAWFASYLFLSAALWVLLSRGRSKRAGYLDFMIDVATIAVVSVLVFWSFSIATIISDPGATHLERTVWSAYPVADAILLALVVRVLTSRSGRSGFGRWIAGGVCLWLAADIAYLHAPQDGAALVMMDLAWMVAPVMLARAVWQVPGLEPAEADSSFLGGWKTQLTIAVGPLLVPPALELVSDLRGQPDQPVQLFVGTAVLITFAFLRTGRLMRSEQRALRELEVARDAALQASQAKSSFLANVSHEVRTPLTTVLATAELLEDTPLSDTQLRLLAKMRRSGDLLQGLVEGILDFSRLETGQLELVSQDVDLHAMVADVAEVYASRARDTGLRFAWHLDPSVPRTVLGDPGRLLQVLSNLLDNAVKFTHDGQVTLNVTLAVFAHDDEPARAVEFVVTDTGIGISDEDLARLFDSFSQVDGSMTRRYGGCGLGLSICQHLTELMGGSITVSSRLGVGTTFAVRLPIAPAPPARTAVGLVDALSP